MRFENKGPSRQVYATNWLYQDTRPPLLDVQTRALKSDRPTE